MKESDLMTSYQLKLQALLRSSLLFLSLSSSFLLSESLVAQQFRTVPLTVCYADSTMERTYVPAPKIMKYARSEQGTANFELTFISVPEDVQGAVRFAADIWESILVSNIPIRVEVNWESLDRTTLASGQPTLVFQSFQLPDPTLWYPVALAESILNDELNESTEFDIRIIINENQNWYRGTDGQAPGNQFDLVTAVLHELAHGLGFFDTADQDDNGEGIYLIQDRPIIYDAFLFNSDSIQLIDSTAFPRPSLALLQAFQGGDIVFNDFETAEANGGTNPLMYAPEEYVRGSSLSHLDSDAYPPGDPNSLMSPEIGRGEVIHDPGPITTAIMRAIGWDQDPPPPVERTEIFLFPNPARNLMRVDLPSAFQGPGLQLEIWDIAGRLVQQETMDGPAQLELDLSRFSLGVYYIRVRRNELNSTSKFTVVR